MNADKPRVSIQIVTWNSMTDIAACLQSVVAQTYPLWSVLVVDNGSLDGTVAWINENYPTVAVLKNSRNLGFARGNNQALLISGGEYVLMVNDDVVLDRDWLSHAVAFMDAHPDYGSYGGKVRRYEYAPGELKEIVFSGIIDTAGIAVTRSRHAYDRGSGDADNGQFDRAEDLFGISGACVLFRRSALESVRYQQEYFDEDYFSYKEDVDLAWRMQRRGWKCRYDPASLAYHHRSAKSIDRRSNMKIARNHRRRSHLISYLSYRNHLLMLMKNETGGTLFRDFLPIIWYELKKLVFLLIANPRALRGLPEAILLGRTMRRKASHIRKQSTVSAMSVRAWFLHSSP